MTIYLLNT